MAEVTVTPTQAAVQAVWRIEGARLVAALTRLVRDIGLAEELAQDALVAALEQWPVAGVPDNPGAWLMLAARRRAIDDMRRSQRIESRETERERLLAGLEQRAEDPDAALDDPVGDDLLRLVFMACHPILAPEARVALTLRLLGGLATDEIARAFLVSEETIAQRIVRAKRTLAESGTPFELPHAPELPERLASVLEVVYLIFNEGYAATAGADWMRPALCEEALRLARILAGLAPNESEVHGLQALLEIHASRAPARSSLDGSPILLRDQDRSRWDRMLIGRGLTALERARALGGLGPYALQAAIAACHARAGTFEETDWERIVSLYERLAETAPSPVVELNLAVAIGMARGPEAGLACADRLCEEPVLARYHLLPSVRGEFLERLGRAAEARVEFERAAKLTRNDRERAVLEARAARLRGP